VARCGADCRSRRRLEDLPGSQTGRAVPPFAGKKRKSRIRTHKEGAGTEVSSDTYPLRTTANRACGEAPRASVPAGTTKVCPAAGFGTIPASGTRGAEGTVRPGQSRRPEDQPPARPAWATALGAQSGRPDSPASPQLPRPRGQVPPRPAPVLQTGTLMPRPQIPTAPSHSGTGSTTPGLAADLG
jgi:hypothetical protein